MNILLFVAGLALLIVGAEALVKGASRLAANVGVSPLVIGLTVVAFGTSSPELAVSIKAAFAGNADIAMGNVIGSNIFNVLFILGLSAMIIPLSVVQQLVRFDVPIMIVMSLLVLLLALDHNIGRVDGLFFLLTLLVYVGFLIYKSRNETAEVKNEYAGVYENAGETGLTWVKNVMLVIFGLGMLVLGSRWLVESAVSFARYLGVSELVVGLTIISAGTSLPEVVTSVIAALRGERDIAVGNVIGSNLFNIMGVLGAAAALSPDGIEVSAAIIGFDIPVMIAVAFACLPIFMTDGVISRKEGLAMFFYYIAYTLYLVMAATHHDQLTNFSAAMMYFVIPITALTLLVITIRKLKRSAD